MRSVGVGVTGGRSGSLARFRNQAVRLLATTISWSGSAARAGVAGDAEISARIASGSLTWWSTARAQRAPCAPEGGCLVLSQEFFQELVAHPVPVDRRVLRALTSSFAFDLYAWTTWRVSRLRRPMSIPWQELALQFGSQERALRNFRVETRRALERVRVFYPRLRFEVTREALRLFPGRGHVAPR
jgi:hypothetical protein